MGSFNSLPGEEAIRVASTIDVEANKLVFVVETIDGRCPNTVRVVDGLPFGMLQRGGQEEPVHLFGPIDVDPHNLVTVVDTQSGRVGRVWEVERGVVLVVGRAQEAHDGAIGGREEAYDIAIGVDACRGRVGATRRNQFLELSIAQNEFVGMIDPVAIGVEADCDAIVIEAKQLVHGSCSGVGVSVGGEDAVMLDEAEVVAIAIDPETSGISMIVDRDDLCLDRTWEVFILVVVLSIGRVERIALVGMSCIRTTAEVARDDATVVNTEELVKGRVSIVVEGLEGVRRVNVA